MKIICSWCKKSLGEKDPFGDHSVTHGICPECEKEENIKIDRMTQVGSKSNEEDKNVKTASRRPFLRDLHELEEKREGSLYRVEQREKRFPAERCGEESAAASGGVYHGRGHEAGGCEFRDVETKPRPQGDDSLGGLNTSDKENSPAASPSQERGRGL